MSSFWLFAVVWLAVSPGGHGDLAGTLTTDGGVVTRCTGSNVTLLEAPPGVTPFHVYVFRGGETIATTSVEAQGLMKDRLFVHGDGSVLLTNLTSDDLGKYRMEVKMTETDINPPKHDIRLVVAVPPRTYDGKLFVQQEPRDGTFVRVKCGVFESLGYPPVSAKWRDPSGQFLASQGFADSFFYLDLPLTTSLSGTYCCQLHCPEPDHCCLQEASALRRCAEVDVTTNKSPDSGRDVTDSTQSHLRALEQRVSTLTDRLQSLQDGQVREGACSQNWGSAMAQLVHLQVKDQLETHWTRLKEWEAGHADLDTAANQTRVAALSDCEKRDLHHRLDELEARFKDRLLDVTQQMADNLTGILQSVADIRQVGAVQVSELGAKMNLTLGDNLSRLGMLSDSEKRQLQQRLDDLQVRFEQRLLDVAQQTGDNVTGAMKTCADLQQEGAAQVSEHLGRLNQSLEDLEVILRADITSLNQSLEDNQSRLVAFSDSNKQRMDELEMRFELRLSDVARQIADSDSNMLQRVAHVGEVGADQMLKLEARLNQTLADLKDTLRVKPEQGTTVTVIRTQAVATTSTVNSAAGPTCSISALPSVKKVREAFLKREKRKISRLKLCRDVLVSTNKSGVYTLRPDGVNTYPVYCDLTTDGGGWLVFQRRRDGSVDFYRDWADYEDGFGDLSSEFWLGLKKLHGITSSRRHRLRVDLGDHQGQRKYAVYENFRVGNASENYRLTVSGYSGTAGDSLDMHNGMSFSTRDRDNDRWHKSCAQEYKGAWWYRSCHFSNLNSLYKASGAEDADGINWVRFQQDRRSLTFTEMKIQPV